MFPDHGGATGGSARQATGLPHRAGRLHRGLTALWTGPVADRSRRVAGVAGPRGGVDVGSDVRHHLGLFPKRAHPRVFGIYGATIGLATICGPLVGGLLIQWDLFGWGWRLIFFVNLPLGLAALVLGYFYLVDAKPDGVRQLDLGAPCCRQSGCSS